MTDPRNTDLYLDFANRLAELYAESSRQEIERNRYKLVQDNAPGPSAQPYGRELLDCW